MFKLLIIEDDLLLDEAYKRKFENLYEVKVATDGESGIKMAKNFQPDVIILDIYMPGRFNGLDVLLEIRKEKSTAKIPVIVITNLPDSVERVVAMGAVRCFMKTDVDLKMIEDEVRSVLVGST